MDRLFQKVRQLVLWFVAGATMLVGAASAQTLKIGVIAPLTGGGAQWGLASAEAPRILADEINAKGGLDVGGKRYKVEVIAYDDQYKAAEAVAAYNRLVNQDGVKYVFILSSAATMALKQNVEDDKILALTSANSSKAIDKNTKNMFRLLSPPEDYVPSIIAWMKTNVSGKRVVVVNPNDETGWELTQLSIREFKANGFEVLGQELFERAQKDFQPMLTKILAMKPDIIEMGSTPPATAGLIIRQARELGYEKSFVKVAGPSPRDLVAAAGVKATEGTINMLFADPANEGFRRIATAYKKARGQEPNELLVSYYDAASVLLNAISKAGTVDDTAKVAASFSKALPMKSVQGDVMSLGLAGDSGINAQIKTINYIGVIRNGEPVVIGKTK